MKKRILVLILCMACVTAFAQKGKKKTTKPVRANTQSASTSTGASAIDTARKQATTTAPSKPFDRPLDGYYKKTNILNAKVTPYPNLRETDVAYLKRVWREIDTREKMNLYLSSPKRRLIDVIMNAVSAGELTAYDATPDPKNDPTGDSFSKTLTPGQALNKMADSSVVNTFDKNGDKVGSKLVAGEFNPDSVVKFRLKEDWIFDRQRSVFEPRIIGIAPLVKVKVAGVEGDYQPAFWIYFPEARQIFSTKEAVSKNSDATGLSFDDIFMKRMFASYIVKVSNEKDERIKDYAQGIDKLYESEKVKKQLMNWELNLWSY